MSNGVSICVMTRIFQDQITRKIQDFYKEIPNFLGNLTRVNLTPKNLGHDADWDTIRNIIASNQT